MKIPPHPLLARGAVHAAGVPVAAVVAHSRALAQDAVNAITVEYAALPVVVNAEKALEPGAPLAREELDSNICYTTTKAGGDVDKAFAEAEHVVRLRIASPRLVALTLEPRGVLAKPEPTGDLTVWLSTQSPHLVRADLATAIGFGSSPYLRPAHHLDSKGRRSGIDLRRIPHKMLETPASPKEEPDAWILSVSKPGLHYQNSG